jgi:hypothetical protein
MITSLGALDTRENPVFLPHRPDYADFDVDVRSSLDWHGILQELGVPVGKYVALFAFRSEKRADADTDMLAQLDEKALIAAEEANGFIHYQPIEGLSYCLWETPEDAAAAIMTPAHREAAAYVNKAYERWHLCQYLVARTATQGEVEFIPPIS